MSDGKKAEKEKRSLAERIIDIFGRKEEGTTLSPVQITRRVGLMANENNVETVDTSLFDLEGKRILISRPSVNAYALNYVHSWQDEKLAIRYIQKYGEKTEVSQQSHNKPFAQKRRSGPYSGNPHTTSLA